MSESFVRQRACEVIVQWCMKGLSLADDEQAKEVLKAASGLVCNWWRDVQRISPGELRQKLTPQNLDMHVNHFDWLDPGTQKPFARETPFISLSAGTVERDTLAQTNHVRRALRTALWFGTDFGRRDFAYIYTCWLVLAPRRAVEVEGLGEEVRDLNTYRRYSAFQTEGEVTAKIIVPDNQLQCCERWDLVLAPAAEYRLAWRQDNPRFTAPSTLTNVR